MASENDLPSEKVANIVLGLIQEHHRVNVMEPDGPEKVAYKNGMYFAEKLIRDAINEKNKLEQKVEKK